MESSEENNSLIKRNIFIRLKNFILRNLATIFVILNVFLIFIGSVLYAFRIAKLIILSRMEMAFLIINLIVIEHEFEKKEYEKNPIYIWIVAITIVSIISSILAKHPQVAFFGFRDRYEGFFVILYYFSTLILATFIPQHHKKIVIGCILATGIIQALFRYLSSIFTPKTF